MTLRIGEVAARTATTQRTIRYYEEIGLLPAAARRKAGAHRSYDEEDVEQLEEVLRLKRLLGISLDELRELVEAERARAARKAEWHAGDLEPARRRRLLNDALTHADRQLELVVRRREELAALEAELTERRQRILDRLEGTFPSP